MNSLGIYAEVATLLLLSGCVHTQTAPEKVYIQVPVSCVKESPILPVIATDAELAKMDDWDLVISIATARIALRQYAKEAAAVISACQ